MNAGTPKKFDFSSFSLPELRDAMAELTALIAEREKTEREEVAAEIERLAKQRGFALADLFPDLGTERGAEKAKGKADKGTGRGTVAPKYRDPLEPSQTWTGRGRKPKWVLEREAEGRTLESMLITSA